MPKPINKLGVTKDAIMQIGAANTRLRKLHKHVSKLGDEEDIRTVNMLIHKGEALYNKLCKDLKNEHRRVKTLGVTKGVVQDG